MKMKGHSSTSSVGDDMENRAYLNRMAAVEVSVGDEEIDEGESLNNNREEDNAATSKEIKKLIQNLNNISPNLPLESFVEGKAAADVTKNIVEKVAVYIGQMNAVKGSHDYMRDKVQTLEQENYKLKQRITAAETLRAKQSDEMELFISLEYFQSELEAEMGRRIKAELELAKRKTAVALNVLDSSLAQGSNSIVEDDPLLPSVESMPPPPPPLPRPPPRHNTTIHHHPPPLSFSTSRSVGSISPPPPSLDHYPLSTRELLDLKSKVNNFNVPPRASENGTNGATDLTYDDYSSTVGSSVCLDDPVKDPSYTPYSRRITRFKRASARKVRMSVHLTVKPFKCTLCGKTMASKSHLQSHLQTHRGVKDFKRM